MALPEERVRRISGMPTRERLYKDYYPLFEKYDDNSIPLKEIETVIDLEEFSSPRRRQLINYADRDRNGRLNFDEFYFLVSKLNARQKAVRFAVSSVLPSKKSGKTVEWYTDHYSCTPPPVFIPIISLIEVAFFIYYAVDMTNKCGKTVNWIGPSPLYSPFIYSPRRRREVWRFFTYMFLHSGIQHLVFNLIVQVLVGIPLEMVHKWWRIAIVYFLGVLGGSLMFSVIFPKTYLLGASGGVFALLGAHLANLIMNWNEMRHEWVDELSCSALVRVLFSAPIRLAFWLLLAGINIALAIYKQFPPEGVAKQSIGGDLAHLGGCVAGLLIGIPVLKNVDEKFFEKFILIASVCLYILLLIAAFVIHAIPTITMWEVEDFSALPGSIGHYCSS